MKPDHSYFTRLGHWLAAIAIPILGLSGLEILRAFPSLGEKLPHALMLPVPDGPGLGGWLGGALSWHVTFAWFFGAAVALQLFDLARGGWRRVWLSAAEWRGIWPVARYYFLRGSKPEQRKLYNPLQKATYLLILSLELVSILTGWALLQPARFWLRPVWAWQAVRALHLLSMLGFLGFLPGHLVMVVLAGRRPFLSMVSGEHGAAVAEGQV